MTITIFTGVIIFCLLISHLGFLLIGWKLALNSDPRLQMSSPEKKTDKSGFDVFDEIDKERLDFK